MPTIAYLANEFPVAVEPYVMEEIRELRKRGVRVIAGSVRKPSSLLVPADFIGKSENICLEPIRLMMLLQALFLIAKRLGRIAGLVRCIVTQGDEGLKARCKALLHTLIGAYYAAFLQDRKVDHIHVHHGYFGSWIAMTAARLLGISFSMTLHGSDLLIHRAYLNEKLRRCRFCITISEYNRQFILRNFPKVDPAIVILSRLGVEVQNKGVEFKPHASISGKLTLFAAGRLHAVKNHIFLILACNRLHDLGIEFECLIAGNGPERERLQTLIRRNNLQGCVTLLGHVAPSDMRSLYYRADLFVLTSISEGIPLVLMESMANGLIVLAPAITGIPELVFHGETGFLYEPGNLDDFIAKILAFRWMAEREKSKYELQEMQNAARMKVFDDFNRQKNLRKFADLFLQSISPHCWSPADESAVLQQVQLSV